MNKYLFLLLLFSSYNCAQEKNTNIYEGHPYYPVNQRTLIYKYANSFTKFKVEFEKEKELINNKLYTVKNTKYFLQNNKSSYCRLENGEIVFLDLESNIDYINIPQNTTTGYKWSDNVSWEYEIIGTNEKLTTPKEEYDNLLVIKASKLVGNQESNKLPEYFNYYQKGVGQVASVVEGEIFTYLVRIKY